MQSPITAKLPAVFIHVTDMQRAVKFYRQILSLPPEAGTDYHNSIVVLNLNNGVDLILDANHAHEITPATSFQMHATCMFPTDNIDASYKFLQEQGVELITEIHRDPNVEFFTFKDPDGNIQMVCKSKEQV